MCLSVCLSVHITRRYCVEAAERNILQSTPQITRKWAPNICRPNSVTVKNVRLLTNNSQYLRDGMLYQMAIKLLDNNVGTVQNTGIVTVEDDRQELNRR